MTGTTTPKPEHQRRRRNAVSTAQAPRRLPTTGREGLAPTPPVPLGAAGKRWWDWAWATPQATTWTHDGFTEALVKRAQLEDQWDRGAGGDFLVDPAKLLPLMLRLDEAFGLTPRSAAQLHMAFEEPPAAVEAESPSGVTDIRDRLKGLGA